MYFSSYTLFIKLSARRWQCLNLCFFFFFSFPLFCLTFFMAASILFCSIIFLFAVSFFNFTTFDCSRRMQAFSGWPCAWWAVVCMQFANQPLMWVVIDLMALIDVTTFILITFLPLMQTSPFENNATFKGQIKEASFADVVYLFTLPSCLLLTFNGKLLWSGCTYKNKYVI